MRLAEIIFGQLPFSLLVLTLFAFARCAPSAPEKLPAHCLGGLVDLIVPWPLVQHWLKCHCPARADVTSDE